MNFFQSGGKSAPFIIINPLSGQLAPKKGGDGETFRGDGNIKSFLYCLVEFDNLSREDQIRFWTSPAVKELPIVALVDSGGKSIHGWIKILNINSINNWQQEIRQKLYEQGLIPLSVDSACSNPARLSRLPGHLRDTGKYQKILWLANPEKEGTQWALILFMHKIADDPAGESEKETNWNDPIPFDDYSLLPEFPVDVLPGMGKKFISELAEITRVDPGLPGLPIPCCIIRLSRRAGCRGFKITQGKLQSISGLHFAFR